MRTTKGIIGFLLAIVLVVGAFPMTASAAKLKVTSQPKTAYASYNKKAKVTVKAKGTGVKYQWYVKKAGAKKFKKTKVKKATYSAKMTDKLKNQQVYCVVKDKRGKTIKTKKVYLRMKATITKQPVDVSAPNGETVNVSVKAKGDGLKYVWYVKNAGADKYEKAAAEKDTYSVEMSDQVNGCQVYCQVTDKYGKSVDSKAVTLSNGTSAPGATPTPTYVSITSQPKDVTTGSGKTVTVTVGANGEGLTYQWYYKDKGESEFKEDTAAKSESYSVIMSSVVAGRQVYCVVTDKYGKTAKSDVVTLNMYSALTVLPADNEFSVERRFVKLDEAFELKATVSGGAGNYKYEWKLNGETAETGTSSGGEIVLNGVLTADILKYQDSNLYDRPYARYVLNVEDADGNTTSTCDYNVYNHSPIVISEQPKSLVATGQIGVLDNCIDTFSLVVQGGDPNATKYQWQYSLDKENWTNITEDNIGSGNGAYFVGSGSPVFMTGKTELLYVSAYFLREGDEIVNNGGVWLRCAVTDPIADVTITSKEVAWVVKPLTVTTNTTGGYCYVTVTGGMGEITYSWLGTQGGDKWVDPSLAGVSCSGNRAPTTTKFFEYELTVADETGLKKTVRIDCTTGEIL